MAERHPGRGLVALTWLGSIALAHPQPGGATPVRGGEAATEQSVNKMEHDSWNKINDDYDSRVLLKLNDPAHAYVTAKSIAHCLATKAEDKAGDLLGGPLTDDPKFHRLNGALSGRYRTCAVSASDMPLFVINAALAEQLLLASPMPAEPANPDLHIVAKFFHDAEGNTMDSVGRCLAAMSPSLVYRLLGTAAGSPQEKQALNAAYSKTPDCGVPAPPAEIPVMEQRSALAIGLYYWVHRSRFHTAGLPTVAGN